MKWRNQYPMDEISFRYGRAWPPRLDPRDAPDPRKTKAWETMLIREMLTVPGRMQELLMRRANALLWNGYTS